MCVGNVQDVQHHANMKQRIILMFMFLCMALLGTSAAVGDRYELVANVEMLTDGDEVIIVCRDYGVAMSSVQEKTYILPTPIDISADGSLAEVSQANTLVLKLHAMAGYWRLETGGGSLCASGSGSYVLTIGDKNNRNGVDKAAIGFDADGNACIDFNVSSYKRIKYNGTDRFACYYTYGVQPSVQLYRKERKVPEVEALAFDELADNSALAADNLSVRARSVTIGRTFAADGGCSTLCLPFALTAADVAETFRGAYVYEYSGVAATADSVVFRFRRVQQTVAGTPYIIVVPESAAGDIVRPELHDKIITAAQPTAVKRVSGGKAYSFVGTLNAAELPAEGSVRFVGSSGRRLVTPNQAAPLRGLRAYFVLPEAVPTVGADASADGRLCIVSLGGQTVGLRQVSADNGNAACRRVFTLSGQAAAGALKRGVYVQGSKKRAAMP